METPYLEPSMISNRAPRALAVVLLAFAVSACASDPKYPGNRESYQAVVEIDNAGSQLSNFTVHLVSANGPRRRLGNVNLNEVKSFDVTRPSAGGYYQFMATLITGYNLYSPQFPLTEGDRVIWDLRRNRVVYAGNYRDGG
jgi:hypothetical protein